MSVEPQRPRETPFLPAEPREFAHPTVVRRYFSTVIDYVLIFCVMALAGVLPVSDQVLLVTRSLILGLGFLIYEPVMSSRACTVGQFLLKVRVRVDGDPDARISIVRAYARYAVKLLLGGPSLFTVPFSARQKAIHDMAIKSMMIRV